MAPDPSIPALLGLLRDGHARVPATWSLDGPSHAGLWWRPDGGSEVVATPALLRLRATLPSDEETVGALLATEPRYRAAWLRVEAARLHDLGHRGDHAALCDAVDALGPAAAALRPLVSGAALKPTGHGATELAVFGAAADQAIAARPLRRALAATAALVEGGLGQRASTLPPVDAARPSVSWCPGRLLQTPDAAPDTAGDQVLPGHVGDPIEDVMAWVLATPWVTLLAVLAFTAEAWAAERRGGVQLELPLAAVQTFGAPPRVDVVVTLPDGVEVLCGSLGELCLRTADALGMAVVPVADAATIDAALAPVIMRLLRARVWIWQPDARPRYAIGDGFSRACYGQAGLPIRLDGERLFETLRATCVGWARSRSSSAEGVA